MEQMVKTAAKRRTMSIEDLRLAVARDLRKNGDMTFIGFDNLEYKDPTTALNLLAGGTVFEIIGGHLVKNGAPKKGGYKTVGDVMSGLGFTDPKEAHDAAHWIGCHCHGSITGDIVADRIEGLNTQ